MPHIVVTIDNKPNYKSSSTYLQFVRLPMLVSLTKEWFLDVFSIDVDALLHKFDISQLTLKSSIKKIEIRIPSRDKC